MTLRDLGDFVAVDPEGKRYVVRAWVDDDGNLTFETANGQPVSQVGNGRYRLARRAVEIVSNDAAAQ